jgi:putative endonuclease
MRDLSRSYVMERAADEVVAWVYLLRCLADDSLYTGWTVDLSRRLAAHQAGTGSRYTRSRLPVKLALALPMPDARTARREEARIKRLRRPEKLALIDNDRTGVHPGMGTLAIACAASIPPVGVRLRTRRQRTKMPR